jgi:putative transposase
MRKLLKGKCVKPRVMIRFKSAGQCQRFVSIHGPISNLFHLNRNRTFNAEHRKLRNATMNRCCEIAPLTAA